MTRLWLPTQRLARLCWRGALLLIVCAFIVTPASALPAPMSSDEMLAKSDLVALVRIWSVTCTAINKDEKTGEALPSYAAQAELIEVVKGEERKGDDVTITFHAIPTGMLGPWSVYYYPGEMVWTHLIKDDQAKGGAAFTTIWWNGRGDVVQPAMINDLPTTPGKTVGLRREPRQTIEQ